MATVVLFLVDTLALLGALGWLCRRPLARRFSRRLAGMPLSPPPAGPEVAELDDAGFRRWLGVLPATYDGYVDSGIEVLGIYLADRPAKRVGEDPAEPAA
jgi:hypothetical protein